MNTLFRIVGFLPYVIMIFLNAFVDLGHKIVVQNAVFKVYDGNVQIILTAIVNALILLPFILVFTPSGFISDKYPKHHVMRISAVIAVFLTIFVTIFYYMGLFWPAFVMIFLMAIQSAIYSPAKYGYIKELVGKESLAQGNGIVQATTTIAILMGAFIFSLLFESYLSEQTYPTTEHIMRDIAPIGWLLIASALLELAVAMLLPQKKLTDKKIDFDWQHYYRGRYLKTNIKNVVNHKVIKLSIIGLSVFWAIGQVLLASFPAFAKETLQITNAAILQGTLACAAIGIMTGSLIAGRLSKNHIETGLIPVGAVGVMLCLLWLPSLSSTTAHAVNFIVLGIFGGLFIIPLNALIQFHAGEDELGKVLAGNNFIQNLTMLSFLILTVIIATLGWGNSTIFYCLMVVAVVGAGYTVYQLPQSMIRFLLAFAIGQRYRLAVVGLRHIPERGGVLLLGNHISWLDWAIVQMACPRPIRFVMAKNIYQRWYLKWFLDFFQVIPISAASSKTSLQSITALLNEGQVVCLFPEGTISRSGQLSEFQKGYEKAAAAANGVILPFYLCGLWGTAFSRASDLLKTARRSGLKSDVMVAFGQSLPMNTPADALKQKIFELSLDAWQCYADLFPSIAVAFMENTKRLPSHITISDSTGDPLTFKKVAIACICFSSLIKKYNPSNHVGLLLPTTRAGAIANIATLMAGKVVVNLNYTANQNALAAAIKKAEISTVFTSSQFLTKLKQKDIDLSPILKSVNVIYLEDLKNEISPAKKLLTLITFSLLPVTLLKWLYCQQVSIDSPAAILFSSGSEGEPKGVVLSHRNIMTNIRQVSDILNANSEDVVLSTLPLFHAFGLSVTTLMPLVEGIPMVCHPDPTDALNVGKAAARHKATMICATSTFLRLYTKNKRLHPLMFQSLRFVVAGAERLNPEVRQAFNLKFNKFIYEGYGATETSPVASVNLPDHLDDVHWHIQHNNKLGTVGLPLPGTSFRIVDPDSLRPLAVGEDGLILISGGQVMSGYLNDDKKTDEAIVEWDGQRWYKTGDKGHVDESGFLTIVDRYSRFAKLGGEMISLTAIEDQIRQVMENPELELVAVNIADEKKGERIEVLMGEAIELEALKARLLAAKVNPLMIPSAVHAPVEIPKLGSGKTDFSQAKQLARDN